MKEMAEKLGLDQNEAIILGLLHDIGYSDKLKETGFHPLDGYNYLKEIDENLAERMLLHTSTPEEAEMRGIVMPVVKEDAYSMLLSYADARVLATGKRVSSEERLLDIINRYGSDHLVSKANIKAWIRLEKEWFVLTKNIR